MGETTATGQAASRRERLDGGLTLGLTTGRMGGSRGAPAPHCRQSEPMAEDSPSAQPPRCVLAFSGGLDTSLCVVWLREELGYDVVTCTVDTGGFDAEELARAQKLHGVVTRMKAKQEASSG